MKKIYCCFIILLCSFYTYAQSNPKLDSLKKVLVKLPKEGTSFAGDTMRVRVLVEMGECSEIPDSIIKFSDSVIRISVKNRWIEGEYIGKYYYAKALKNKGLYFKALDIFFNILRIVEKKNMLQREGIILRDIADTYLWISDYQQAIEYYNKSMNIFEKLHEYEEYADTQNNLAITYSNIKQYDKAIALLKNCLTFLPFIKGKRSEINFYNNLSMAYGGQKKYDIALKYSQKAMKRYDVLNSTAPQIQDSKSKALIIMGFNYLRSNNIQKALEVANQAVKLNEKYGGNQIDLNQLYYEIYETKKDFKLAFEYLKKFIVAEQQKTQVERVRQIEALKSDYQLDLEKTKVIGLNKNLEKEEYRATIMIIVLCFTLIFFMFVLWSFLNQRHKNKLIEKQKMEISFVNQQLEEFNKNLEHKVAERTLELTKVNQELFEKNQEIIEALFKGQSIERKRVATELHDNLGSMLSSIKWRLEALNVNGLTEKEQKIYEGIHSMMHSAYSEVRLISHNMLPAEFENNGLKGAIEKLINDLNQSGRTNFTFESSYILEVDKKVELELYSICLELLNNTLKHAQAKNVQVVLNGIQNIISLLVKDDGKGIDINQKSGFGLSNIKNRVEAISGKLIINSNPFNETSLLIEVPL